MTEEKQPETIEKQEEPKKDSKKKQEAAPKRTLCWLISKGDYIIEIKQGEQITFVQPFGKIKVVKELVQIHENDARYLSFAKIK